MYVWGKGLAVGRVRSGQTFCRHIAGRVGSTFRRVGYGSKKREPVDNSDPSLVFQFYDLKSGQKNNND